MGARKHPLELVLRAHGTAELVDADNNILWVSDSDDKFKEEFTDEFLNEEDSEEILNYLLDERILTQMEFNALICDRWDVTVETLNMSAGEADDDDEEIDGDLDPDDADDENEDDWE